MFRGVDFGVGIIIVVLSSGCCLFGVPWSVFYSLICLLMKTSFAVSALGAVFLREGVPFRFGEKADGSGRPFLAVDDEVDLVFFLPAFPSLRAHPVAGELFISE